MKGIIILIGFIISPQLSFGQSAEYLVLIKKADSLYKAKDYKSSVAAYTEAFKANDWKAQPNDRYKAACSWALAKYPDSAFFQLNWIATENNFTDYERIKADPELNSLHADVRWGFLLYTIKQNMERAGINPKELLMEDIDSIGNEYQKEFHFTMETGQKYGWESTEVLSQWKILNVNDSIRLYKLKSIIDKGDWHGDDELVENIYEKLSMILRRAPEPAIQEKYLPLMKDFAKKTNFKAPILGFMEDNVALANGNRQIYGSIIGRDSKTQLYYVMPLDDPDNVDKRRAAIGLEPLNYYLKEWKLVWDVEQYKKDLPRLEAIEKEKLESVKKK